MDITQFSQINPPQRLLMGPGPINADPRVLRAMSSQLVGQYDPAMTHYMNEVMALYRGVFRTENRWTMLVDGTSRAGIEAINPVKGDNSRQDGSRCVHTGYIA